MAKKIPPRPSSSAPNSKRASVHTRSVWNTLFRWVGVVGLSMLYVAVAAKTYNAHFVLGKPFSGSEATFFFMVTFASLMVVPQLVLECQVVKLEEDGIRFRNLFFGLKERWEDLKWFQNRAYLKFCVVRGKKFIYLLNRRDLSDFDLLIEEIKTKAINMTK